MLPSLILAVAGAAAGPPLDIGRRVAERETKAAAERGHYTYRQRVVVEEMDSRGVKAGEYREVRDIVFSPEGERFEKLVGQPQDNLKRLRMTEEDFRDVREVQPFLFSTDLLWAYQVRYKGEETMEEVACWVLDVRPRQVLEGQRLFEGLMWVDQRDFSIIRSEGRAVPQILRKGKENLFPRFTTIRRQVDGDFWFPVLTFGDDVLPFSTGPLRMRLQIQYSDYKRFSAESEVRFEGATPAKP